MKPPKRWIPPSDEQMRKIFPKWNPKPPFALSPAPEPRADSIPQFDVSKRPFRLPYSYAK